MPNRSSEAPAPAYRALAAELRQDLLGKRFDDGRRLPTEAELADLHKVSRQTVRRAMQDLVAEGYIYRVPGRGTFATQREGQYLRQFGSIEDLLSFSIDTELEVVSPLQRRVSVEAASRLRLESDTVMAVTYRRIFDGTPIGQTTVFLPPAVGALLQDSPELTTPGATSTSAATIIGLLAPHLDVPIVEADQSITVDHATPAVAEVIGCAVGQAVLRIDRVYLNEAGAPTELSVGYFHPEHYTYRVRLRRGS
jgi:GntR family transcriptional regulator